MIKRAVVPLFLVAALLAGAGVYLVTRFEGPPEDTTAALVPFDAEVYASFFVDPSSDQKRLLRDRTEEADEDVDVGSLVEDILDRVTRPYGLPYTEIQPWVDRQLALFVMRDGNAAIVAEIADQDAARRSIERAGGRMLGDHAVFGDEAAVRAAIQVHRSKRDISLRGPDSFLFDEANSDVPDDRIAFAFSGLYDEVVDLPESFEGAELLLGIGGGNAVSLRATESGLAFDGFSYSDGAELLLSGEDNPLKDLGTAGADAWAAAIFPNLSGAVEGIERELRQTRRVSPELLARLPVPAEVAGTDQTLVWVGGESLATLSAGLDATTDGSDATGRLSRSLAEIPGLDPRFDFGRNRLRATAGSVARGGLDGNERYREARSWLGRMVPIGFLDVRRAGPLLSLAGTAAGATLPSWVDDLDRVVVGIDEEVAPTHWRVVISLRE